MPQPGAVPTKEKPFIQEWETLRREVVRPAVASRIRGLALESDFDRTNWCKWFRSTDLRDALSAAQNTVIRNPDGTIVPAPQADMDRARKWALREARELSINAERYPEIGCPADKLKAIAKEVEKLVWPNDPEMQNQRVRLLAAFQRALARAAVK